MEPDPRAAISGRLGDLAGAVHRLDRAVSGGIGDVTWQEAALILRHVTEQVDLLRAVAGTIEAQIIAAYREQGIREPVEVPGVGVVEVRRSKNRRSWDHEGLSSHVLDRHLTERADGEMPTPWEVRDWLMEAAGIGYWKVTTLRALGLDPGDFCDETPGPRTVTITGGPAHPGQDLPA